MSASSPDGLRAYTLPVTFRGRARVIGTTPMAPGSSLTLSFDNRLLDDATVEVDSTAAVAQTPTVNGNTTTVTFTLPVTIPTTADGVEIVIDFGVWNQEVWLEDVEPYSTLLLPATGSDSDSSNNGWTSTAQYVDTSDAAVSATWRPVTIVDGNGANIACNVAETITVTALTPGDIPSGTQVYIMGPSASDGIVEPFDSINTLTGVTVTSAVLDGVDVSDLIGAPASSTFTIPVNTVIPAGQSLTLTLDVDVISSAPGWVWPGGSAGFNGGFDRDALNNNIQAPTP